MYENNLQLMDDPVGARHRWEAFWQGEMIDRQVVCIIVKKQDAGNEPIYEDNYYTRMYSDLTVHVKEVLDNLSRYYYLGEAIPKAFLSFGPDEIAAFLRR